MLPVYNPLDFENLDLRKYHIKSGRDLQRFLQFIDARLDEAQHVVKQILNENSTLKAVTKQMQAQQNKIAAMYGAPTGNQPRDIPAGSGEAVVQTVEDETANKERESLLDEMRQAVANEEQTEDEGMPQIAEEDNNQVIEYDKYKLVVGAYQNGKERLFWYRDAEKKDGTFFKKLVSEKDVPDDIKHNMLAMLGRE